MGGRRRQTHGSSKEDELCCTPISDYEQSRDERIRENLEKMKKLGLFELSLGLKPNNTLAQPRRVSKCYKTPPLDSPLQSLSEPTRRSSRLKNASPVTYSELKLSMKNRVSLIDEEDILSEKGSRPEIYSEKHEKLLGSTEKSWTLFVDGCGSDGKRVYDQIKGKTCHQCRQKTLGYRTRCSECDMVQGQFCGDCLYMRYGEHVLEARDNPNWICPVCRGICNCSLCRNGKGWAPTGPLYKKITRLGFKSVAHYLIQTRRSHASLVNSDDANENLVKRSLAFSDVVAQPEPLVKLEEKNDDQYSSKQPPLLLVTEPAIESNANQKEEETVKLKQSSPATLASVDENISDVKLAEIECHSTPLKTTPSLDSISRRMLDFKQVDHRVFPENGVEKYKTELPSEIKHLRICEAQSKTTTLKHDVSSSDSIGGRLRKRRSSTSEVDKNEMENGIEVDSIGGRLRKRRSSTSEVDKNEMENGIEEPPIDNNTPSKTKTPKLNQKRALIEVPSLDSVAGRLRQRRKTLGVDDMVKPSPTLEEKLSLVVASPPNTPLQMVPKLAKRKKNLALVAPPSPESIGGRLRLRRNSE